MLPAVVLLAATACGSAPTGAVPAPSNVSASEPASASARPSATSSPTSTAQSAATAYVVLVDLFAAGSSYNIALAGADARVVARVQAAKRSEIADAIELPYVSASRSRVYYLDGDRDVRYLKTDGTFGLAASVSGGARVHAAFAVSPDDSRIAVALLDYSVNPVALTLYVEDLGGAHHAVIFTSTIKYVWPVAWHSGQLVVANLGPNAVPFKSKAFLYPSADLTRHPLGPSPYGGINFHVIDPVTAVRQVIISGGGSSELLTKAGTAVVQGQGVDWRGSPIFWHSPHDYGSFSASGSISPNGRMIAACCPTPAFNGNLVIWTPGDQSRTLRVLVTSIDWVGWLDNSRLVTGFYHSSDGTPSVIDVSSGDVKAIDAHGLVAGIFPSDLEP